jgi:uncharacterized alpha-E superfamily protein
MLSRVADAMFWMSRYIERADHVARLLEVAFNLQLDLHAVAGAQDLQWQAILAAVQQPPPEDDNVPLGPAVSTSLTFDLSNPASIMTSINRSRNNARSIRGSISSDVWRELNKLYWQVTDPEFRKSSQDSPHQLYQSVQTGSQLFQGICDATMIHDEGWRFIQLGKYLERAIIVLRVIDARQRQLSALAGVMELSLQNLHWASVLKSCQAYQAYQQIYISRLEPERVMEFLLLNPDFPYSVQYCLKSAAENLAVIGEQDEDRAGGRAGKLLGRMILDLEYAEPSELVNGQLRTYLENAVVRCNQATVAVQHQYLMF